MQNVILGWFLRRGLELGGIFSVIVTIYMALPPFVQAAITRVLTGDASAEQIAIAIGGIGVALWGYIWSFRATTATQVVTTDGQKIVPKAGSAVEAQINEVAVGVKPASLKPTLWEQLASRFGR